MTVLAAPDAYGALIEPATLRIERLLPGPIDRVWAYLTESDLRRKWLAAGVMKLEVGAPFELVWRNHELTDPPGKRPPDKDEEHRMQSRITALDPPRRLAFTFQGGSEVSFELEPVGDEVLLTVIHRRVPDRKMLIGVSSGWHAHLDVLVKRLKGETPPPFWDELTRLRQDYDRRLSA
ncbi:MAG: SRPBCC family protein [Hyphomicrobiales bacterium]|nr:SRPBCC family protein [Hyphomicrobiales bacterium]